MRSSLDPRRITHSAHLVLPHLPRIAVSACMHRPPPHLAWPLVLSPCPLDPLVGAQSRVPCGSGPFKVQGSGCRGWTGGAHAPAAPLVPGRLGRPPVLLAPPLLCRKGGTRELAFWGFRRNKGGDDIMKGDDECRREWLSGKRLLLSSLWFLLILHLSLPLLPLPAWPPALKLMPPVVPSTPLLSWVL